MEQALARSRDRQDPPRASRPRIRLMVVDDSIVARAVLSRMIESDPQIEIAAVAGTAEDAIDALGEVRVDVVLLDLEMPGAGGLKLLPRIITAAAGARVLIVSSLANDGAEESVAALALGAADTLPKPGTGRFNGRFSEVLLNRIRALGYADSAPVRQSAARALAHQAPLRSMASDPIACLAIGSSTGGIHALNTIFERLPRRIGVPILITQHLPIPFMSVFARQLAIVSGREALVATDGMALLPDRIILAPGDAHLTVDALHGTPVVRLVRGTVTSGCLPSVDPMMASVGSTFGGSALGIVLTGMGRDGVEGATKLVACGGSVIVQDEASSAVWGMPRAVLEAGLACAVMAPDKIARRIASRTGEVECR